MNTWTLRRGYPILLVDPPPAPKSGGPDSSSGSSNSSNGSSSGASAGAGPASSQVALSQMPFDAPRSFVVGLPYTPVGTQLTLQFWPRPASLARRRGQAGGKRTRPARGRPPLLCCSLIHLAAARSNAGNA
jgi:hypothetical protein